MGLSRAELKRLGASELERLETLLEQVVSEREAGRVPWLCDVPDCDGRPHPGRMGVHARASQHPPPGNWDTWMALAGRGWGKTRTGAEWSIDKARTQERGALIGPTAADVRDILVEGESGILACASAMFRPEYRFTAEPDRENSIATRGATKIVHKNRRQSQ